MRIKLSISVLFLVLCANAQNPNKLIREGNSAYADSSFVSAEESYRSALAADQNSFNAVFNLADAIYKQENYEEASTLFQALTEKTENKSEKAMAYHNLGNSLLQEEKLEESIEAYKNALRNNPFDSDTKHNLAYAQYMKQQQEQNQEEKEQEQEQNQEEKEQEQEEQEQSKEEEQEEQQSNNQNQEQQPQEEQKPKEAQNPDQISKEEAEKMLDALQQQEKELQEDLQKKKAKGVRIKIEKDW